MNQRQNVDRGHGRRALVQHLHRVIGPVDDDAVDLVDTTAQTDVMAEGMRLF